MNALIRQFEESELVQVIRRHFYDCHDEYDGSDDYHRQWDLCEPEDRDKWHPFYCNDTGLAFETCFHTVAGMMEVRDIAKTFRFVWWIKQWNDEADEMYGGWNHEHHTSVWEGDLNVVSNYLLMYKLASDPKD